MVRSAKTARTRPSANATKSPTPPPELSSTTSADETAQGSREDSESSAADPNITPEEEE